MADAGVAFVITFTGAVCTVVTVEDLALQVQVDAAFQVVVEELEAAFQGAGEDLEAACQAVEELEAPFQATEELEAAAESVGEETEENYILYVAMKIKCVNK